MSDLYFLICAFGWHLIFTGIWASILVRDWVEKRYTASLSQRLSEDGV